MKKTVNFSDRAIVLEKSSKKRFAKLVTNETDW